MRKTFLLVLALLLMLVSACAPVPTPPVSDCPGAEINPLGQSIAESYAPVSYEQVIGWYCQGAEFEDILTALETAEQTDTPPDEMLSMLADGFSWEEIWQVVGLTE